MHFFHKYIPVVNTVVATSALAFQICVLYPWHKRLSQEFDEMKTQGITIQPCFQKEQ